MNDALVKFLSKVEAGDVVNDGSMFHAFGDAWVNSYDAYHGSLDAAKALHEAVLPDWRISLYEEDSGEFNCIIGHKTYVKSCEETWSKCPARAWLIAIIKTLIAQDSV
jgi:hypothetical protein